MGRILQSVFIITICALFFLAFESFAGEGKDDPFVPWAFNVTPKKGPAVEITEIEEPLSFASKATLFAMDFFINYVSKVDGDRCPMYPTCSAYGVDAIRKHGFLIGIVMTADRLIHENNEMDYAVIVKKGARHRYFDPLSNNDFWWSSNDVLSLDRD
ncbi:MAG: membrane protein insertion efficiency factor YidD [Deltaproteobacteria bacterium]|nr:membrane protein insertion efficiency factor YidD [Deltaproteobacteria bacterium]